MLLRAGRLDAAANHQFQNPQVIRFLRGQFDSGCLDEDMDEFLRQAYLIEMGISEIESIFDQGNFELDSDLLLWITLKTAHVIDVPVYEHFCVMTLDDLQE